MRKERIEKAVEIINYAIKNQISVKEASKKSGFADTYVKNIKALVYELYEDGELEKELYILFDEAYKLYAYYRGFGIKEDDAITESKKPDDIPPSTNGEDLKYSEKGNEATIEWKSGSNYPTDHIKTLPELLKVTEVDTELWDVAQYWVNKWDVTAVIDKTPRTFQNFQVKARLEKKLTVVKEKAIGELFLDMCKNYKPPVLATYPKTRGIDDDNNLFEVTIFDLHLGKLAWGGETGENYDTKIARQRFLNCIQTLIKNASGFQYNRILFPIGSDFFNSDTIFNTTTKGTPQDEDLRWQKTFNVGVRLLIDAISLLKQIGVPIDVVNIPGNHDFERSFYLGSYLEAWYNHDTQVKINNGASPRKYYRFGKVLLGITHGSEEKEGSLPLIMASDIESKPMWSETTYHEWHVGHIHRKRDVKYSVTLDKSKMTDEDLGVTVRYLSSLTGTEEWHHKKGFIGALKAGEGFIWNDEAGMIAHLNANLIIQ
ncbi:MAG: hypothetical protein WC428_00280 [Candidatus Paceibacterota bacterium]